MLRNVSIIKLIDVLTYMQTYTTHCDIDLDEKGNKVLFRPIYSDRNGETESSIENSQPKRIEDSPEKKVKKDKFDDRNLGDLIP